MALAVKIELFKRGCFDFITVKDGKKHEKQERLCRSLQTMSTQSFCMVVVLVVLSRGLVLPGFFLCAFVIQVPNGLLVELS